MKDILSEIIAHKRIEIAQQKQAVSLSQLQEQAAAMLHEDATAQAAGTLRHRSMKQSLASSPSGIIAEFKRRSPSKGWIKETAQAELIPPAYEAAGASVLSILTDEKFFGGTLRDIRTVRPLVNIPILRKDFIIDEYQLLQARIVGADAVLLIAACLTPDECHTLTLQAHELGLEVLLEVHSSSELSYIYKETDMVGVNNRHLGSFVTDVENSFRIAEELQQAVTGIEFETPPLLVSESGISSPETIRQLRSAGFRGFLMGEAFMRTENPGNTLKELIHEI
ncbi:indole-3-glycerol phosphate synthase TrpC [uncultured Bacteroides sp.]|uniref:indole-3-glycerol phosphate synthase TrpC n=1 Tax=uncultured Bacteroides sp. TaxID=162156 RepID=UPI0025F08DE8|nr:indole-3-glycerol phosphate synthase TrpC [uncultured Bacteroides sp.]